VRERKSTLHCSRGEMDIIAVFGTVVVGSSPAGSTFQKAQCNNAK
jgi:hypothetical protein